MCIFVPFDRYSDYFHPIPFYLLYCFHSAYPAILGVSHLIEGFRALGKRLSLYHYWIVFDLKLSDSFLSAKGYLLLTASEWQDAVPYNDKATLDFSVFSDNLWYVRVFVGDSRHGPPADDQIFSLNISSLHRCRWVPLCVTIPRRTAWVSSGSRRSSFLQLLFLLPSTLRLFTLFYWSYSALLVLSTVYLFMSVFLSPDIILCG